MEIRAQSVRALEFNISKLLVKHYWRHSKATCIRIQNIALIAVSYDSARSAWVWRSKALK
jgi:hypothetical protein